MKYRFTNSNQCVASVPWRLQSHWIKSFLVFSYWTVFENDSQSYFGVKNNSLIYVHQMSTSFASSSNYIYLLFSLTFCRLTKQLFRILGHFDLKWSSLPPHYASWHRSVSPRIPLRPWFCGLSLPRNLIFSQRRLHLGHNWLPNFSFYLARNSSSLYTTYPNEIICDLQHILFDCLYQSSSINLFMSSLSYFSLEIQSFSQFPPFFCNFYNIFHYP